MLQEEDEDGEIRRAYRKRSVSSTSRRSLVSISVSTTRSLNTSPPSSQHTSSPPLVRAHTGSQHGSHVSTPSSPSMPVSHAPHRKYHTFHHTPAARLHMNPATFTADGSTTVTNSEQTLESTPSIPKSDLMSPNPASEPASTLTTVVSEPHRMRFRASRLSFCYKFNSSSHIQVLPTLSEFKKHNSCPPRLYNIQVQSDRHYADMYGICHTPIQVKHTECHVHSWNVHHRWSSGAVFPDTQAHTDSCIESQ